MAVKKYWKYHEQLMINSMFLLVITITTHDIFQYFWQPLRIPLSIFFYHPLVYQLSVTLKVSNSIVSITYLIHLYYMTSNYYILGSWKSLVVLVHLFDDKHLAACNLEGHFIGISYAYIVKLAPSVFSCFIFYYIILPPPPAGQWPWRP